MTPTIDTRARLELVASNDKPMGRGETHRSAVRAVQTALADLNSSYMLSVEADGFYGARTATAVETFQRDYGLFADGVVGKQTIVQLDAIYSTAVSRQPIGISVHIGVDELDADHYGESFALPSCVNDARGMASLAEAVGYRATIFENENATVANFTGLMRYAAANLFTGDTLLFTFSGHGSQVTDNGSDAEADGLDETFCFYDRMLVDDEFYALMAELQRGVRVIGVFDSCHSGTAAKRIGSPTPEQDRRQRRAERLEQMEKAATAYEESTKTVTSGGEKYSTIPLAEEELRTRLDKDLPPPPPPPAADGAGIAPLAVGEGLEVLADLYADGTTGKGKLIDSLTGIYDKNQDVYDSVRDAAGPKEQAEIQATMLTLAACNDAQTTPAGSVYSLFTYNIITAWNRGGFTGNYSQFHRALLDRSRADATPVLTTYGRGAENMLYVRPFST
ncbi:caspase family protein [Nonomuraea sp. GTA35]|uniref:caspase family protein n=1 Tax=Nonomuraea sp. GTA35 TaxID=1676746 RepID=UPI0035BF00C1